MENLKGNCPICDALISLPQGTEESEIISCSDCNNQVVVSKIEENNITLEQAPEIEEDWGE